MYNIYNIFSTFFIVKKKKKIPKINRLLLLALKLSFVALKTKTWLFLHFIRHDSKKYYGCECVLKQGLGDAME